MVLGGPDAATSSGRAPRIPGTDPQWRHRLPGSCCILLPPSWIQVFVAFSVEHSPFSWWCLGTWFASSSAAASSWAVVAHALSQWFCQFSSTSLTWTSISTLAPDFSRSSWLGAPLPISAYLWFSPYQRCEIQSPFTAYLSIPYSKPFPFHVNVAFLKSIHPICLFPIH